MPETARSASPNRTPDASARSMTGPVRSCRRSTRRVATTRDARNRATGSERRLESRKFESRDQGLATPLAGARQGAFQGSIRPVGLDLSPG